MENNPQAMPTLQDHNNLKILRLLVTDPRWNQRDLAVALGVSLGKTNYCLKALVAKGLIKIQNFRSSHNKLAYVYLLTPLGIAEKANLSARFLKYKLAEYDRLQGEIELLKGDLEDGLTSSSSNCDSNASASSFDRVDRD